MMFKLIIILAFVLITNTTSSSLAKKLLHHKVLARNLSSDLLISTTTLAPELRLIALNMDYLFTLYNDIKFWRDIFIIVGACITIIGITLNTLCIYIFYRTKLFQNSSFPYYVYVLSIIDTLNLIIRYVVPQTTETIISNILHFKYNATTSDEYELYTNEIVSESHCNILMYIHNTLGFASTWIMAAVSAERYLVIKYPLQSKKLIKLRAFIILISIGLIVMLINIFDFAPDFYSKPQWFSNLTLLCEPHDSMYQVKFGLISFNADALSFARTLLQAVGPFLVALYFNSLIIHNFKRIKTAAHQRLKSQSTASVMSHSSNFSKQHNISSQVVNLNNTNNGNIDLTGTRTLAIPSPHLYGSTLAPPSHDSTYGSQTNLSVCVTPQHSPSHKYSFRRRLSKLKLNRETDIMLIVLSFSILITQLPCTITWYLIYYRLILTYINDIYLAARSPILLYILRLFEMLYFSLNFIFYIALSPSLRRELKTDRDRFLERFCFAKPKQPVTQNQLRAQTPRSFQCTPLITCKNRLNSFTHNVPSESVEKLRKHSSSLSSNGSGNGSSLANKKSFRFRKSRKNSESKTTPLTQTPKIIINDFYDEKITEIHVNSTLERTPPPSQPPGFATQIPKTEKSCNSISSLAYIDGVDQSTIHDANETFSVIYEN